MNQHVTALIILTSIVLLGIIGALFALHDHTDANNFWQKYQEEQAIDSAKTESQQEQEQERKITSNQPIQEQTFDVKQQALLIISGAEKQFSESIPINEQETALKMLQKLSDQGRITMQISDSNLGAFIEELNGTKNNSSEHIYWFLYRNGKSSNVGASTLVVQPNDTIEWRYEKAN